MACCLHAKMAFECVDAVQSHLRALLIIGFGMTATAIRRQRNAIPGGARGGGQSRQKQLPTCRLSIGVSVSKQRHSLSPFHDQAPVCSFVLFGAPLCWCLRSIGGRSEHHGRSGLPNDPVAQPFLRTRRLELFLVNASVTDGPRAT